MAKKANGEGSIYRRKVDGMYVGSITLEDGKRKYFYSKKRQEVYDKMQKALQGYCQVNEATHKKAEQHDRMAS